MPRFEPFTGLRYDFGRFDPKLVTAPPYDVIDASDRERLLAGHANNIVAIDLPQPGDAADPYERASQVLDDWRATGVLVVDERPCFYVYRMEYQDATGERRHTTGVLGALELREPGPTDDGSEPILPHEHTTPKAKGDRLALLRATGTNLSPVWGLSPAEGLSAALESDGPADATWSDPDGVTHSLWIVDDDERIATISALVESAPVVIADGHHRYETSLAYRDERRDATGAGGASDSVMIYMVELADDELAVLPIHRLISNMVEGTDIVALLEPFFEMTAADAVVADELMLVTPQGAWRMEPRPEAMQGVRDLDSARLALALESFPEHELVYQHGIDNIVAKVADGTAQAGFLLRPATVAQIVDIAHGGNRMPPKTTYFHPKPTTGVVLRDVR